MIGVLVHLHHDGDLGTWAVLLDFRTTRGLFVLFFCGADLSIRLPRFNYTPVRP